MEQVEHQVIRFSKSRSIFPTNFESVTDQYPFLFLAQSLDGLCVEKRFGRVFPPLLPGTHDLLRGPSSWLTANTIYLIMMKSAINPAKLLF